MSYSHSQSTVRFVRIFVFLWRSIDWCQTRASFGRHHLTVSLAHFSTHWGHVFFLSFPLIFYLITGSILYFKRRKFGNHVIVYRPPDHLHIAPQAYQCLISHFLASLGPCSLILYIHTIHVVINWQLSKQCIRWPVSPDLIAGSGLDPLSSSVFLKLSADKLLLFKWSQAQVQISLRHVK